MTEHPIPLIIAALILFAAIIMISDRMKLQKLRKDRQPFSYAEFRSQLPEDISDKVVQDVLSKLRENVGELPFRPDDHVINDYGIDDEDLEDMLVDLFKNWNVYLDGRSISKLLPDPPTVLNLIVFCDTEVKIGLKAKASLS